MTHEKNTTTLAPAQELQLSPEEKSKLNPAQLDLVEKAQAMLANGQHSFFISGALGMIRAFRNRLSVEQDAQEIASDMTAPVIEKEKEPQQISLLPLLGYLPSDMTRVSPFFPMSLQEKHEAREYLQSLVISSGNWGRVTYTGPKLSTFDEDVFIVLQGYLHLANPKGTKPKLHTTESGKTITIYDYRGPALPFLKMLGIEKPGKRDYDRLKASAKRLMQGVVEFELSAGKTKRGNQKIKKTMATTMFNLFGWDEQKKELVISFNPYFYEMYIVGSSATTIELAERMALKSPIAKGLHRFIMGQKLDGKIPYHYMTLAAVTNMNLQQPDREIRRQLKSALKELIEKNVIGNGKTDPFLTGKDKEKVRLIRPKKTAKKLA